MRVWTDAVFTIPIESRIDTPQILLDVARTIGTIHPSVHKYQVEKNTTGPTAILGPSIRFTGYTGKRPVMTEEQRQVSLHATALLPELSLWMGERAGSSILKKEIQGGGYLVFPFI